MKSPSANLSARFDAHKFCASNQQLSAIIEPDQLERAQEICEIASPVALEISGALDSHKRAKLRVAVKGEAAVLCQRCARDFTISLDSEATLWVAANARQSEELEASIPHEDEVILSQDVENALQLAEDQILLSIPFSPRCNLPDCAVPAAKFSE